MADQQHWTPAKRRKFLAHFGKHGNRTRAAEIVGMSRKATYELEDRDPEFKEAVEQARQEAYDRLEGVAQDRAVDGWLESTYELKSLEVEDPDDPDNSKLISDLVETKRVRRFDHTLLVRLLMANRPERFRTNSKLEVDAGEGAINLAELLLQAARDDAAEKEGKDE